MLKNNHLTKLIDNVKIQLTQNNKAKLIKLYDDHSIFVLPSFTEGHPMVLLEALARRRPVIIFDDIQHVIGKKREYSLQKEIFQIFCKYLMKLKKISKQLKKT